MQLIIVKSANSFLYNVEKYFCYCQKKWNEMNETSVKLIWYKMNNDYRKMNLFFFLRANPPFGFDEWCNTGKSI